MTRLEEVVAQMPKGVKDRVHFGSDVFIDKLATPSIGMTLAMNGGFGRGRIITLWGPKAAGKSTFCLGIIAEEQRNGNSCAYLDVEGTYDPKWAERLGVNNDNLIHLNTVGMNDMVDDCNALIRAGIDTIVVDSITALIPAAYMDGEEVGSMADAGRLGALSADLSKGLPMINATNSGRPTNIFLVSQQRAGGMFWSQGATGGNAIDHYSSQIIKLFSSEGKAWTVNGQVKQGNRLIEKPVARKVMWTIEKSKVGPQGASGEYYLYYDGEFVGIDNYAELVDVAVEVGVIEKAGTWYKYDGESVAQGQKAMSEYLRENPEIYEKIRGDTLGQRDTGKGSEREPTGDERS